MRWEDTEERRGRGDPAFKRLTSMSLRLHFSSRHREERVGHRVRVPGVATFV